MKSRGHEGPALDETVTEIAGQGLAARTRPQIPPEGVRCAAEAANAGGMQPILMMPDAQGHKVGRVVGSLLGAERDVMLVQPAARGASRRLAAPAVALEDVIAP